MQISSYYHTHTHLFCKRHLLLQEALRNPLGGMAIDCSEFVQVQVMKHHCYVNHWAQPETEKTHIFGHGHAQTENQQHSNSKQRQQQAEATPVVCISCRKASAHRKLSPRRSRHSWKCACTCSSFFVLLLLLFFLCLKNTTWQWQHSRWRSVGGAVALIINN